MNWLKDAIVYEIYPQSFYDYNGDGIGDLKGIIEKLDYVKECGFTAIWLNPINESTFFDGGYDVTDFYKVAKRYGTNEDYKNLCDKAHSMGMKVIFDLVAGHTSNQHPWFIESCKCEENEYTNRYIWTGKTFESFDGIVGYAERDAGYKTNFYWCQPALNYGYAHPDQPWQLPVTHKDCIATKNELKKIIDFWIDLGTDGFRVDMAASLIKGDVDGSYTRAFWKEIKEHIRSKNPDVLLISEWGFPDRAINSYFDLDFYLHFAQPAYTSLFRAEKGRNTSSEYLGNSYFSLEGKGSPKAYLKTIKKDLAKTTGKGYIGHITGNHDMPRLAYRRTDDEIRCAFVFLFTMPGVPFVYYGDEIGMDFIEGLKSKEGSYVRTGSRTPMQWNSSKNAGFSVNDNTYLPVDNRENFVNVDDSLKNPDSLLSFVKELIALRKNTKELSPDADFKVVKSKYPLCYKRTIDGSAVLIAINPSSSERTIKIKESSNILLSKNIIRNKKTITLGAASFAIIIE